MRLVRANQEALIFNVSIGEQRMLIEVLGLYPVVPAAYQPLSRSIQDKPAGDDQALLDEALAEQRESLRKQIHKWLTAPHRFRQVKTGLNFSLHRGDTDWLLQALNDVRVGHWLLLGAPDEMLDMDDLSNLDPELHRAWFAMEMAGMFQMQILQALGSESSS